MTLFHKRLIYLGFFVVFFVSAPLILFYAAGYRYNSQRQVLQKTGAINVESYPDNARLIVNGKVARERTPTRMTNLMPQEYRVQIEKNGYYTWEKDITVRASETTFISNAVLFKKTTIPEFIKVLPEDVSRGYATSTSARVGSYEAQFVTGEGERHIQLQSLFSNATATLTTVPSSSYVFYDTVHDWLIAKDTLHDILYLWQVADGQVVKQHTLASAEGFSWGPNHELLLYYNDFEIWAFELSTGRKELITRLAAGIEAAVWHPRGGYVIYLTNNTVKASEVINSFDRETYELVSLPRISRMIVTEAADILYVDAEVGNQKGWFKLEIQ